MKTIYIALALLAAPVAAQTVAPPAAEKDGCACCKDMKEKDCCDGMKSGDEASDRDAHASHGMSNMKH